MRLSPLLIGSAAMTLAACTPRETKTASGENGGTMILALAGDAVTLYPPAVGDLTGRLVQDQVFDRLAEIGQDLSTIGDKGFSPRLAKSWKWAPDSMSIAFSLDPRARWHDGKPVTAKDVQFSLKAFTDPKFASSVASLLTNLDSVQVKDSLTPVVWFKKHTPEQFYDVAYQLIIMPEHVYGGIPAEQLRTSAVAEKPIGSGRFRFVRWEKDTRIELIADTSNYRGRARLDRIVITPTPDQMAAAAAALNGQVDFAENFPLDRSPVLDTSSKAFGKVRDQFGHVFLAMNPTDRKNKNAPHPIFGDVRVRRALSMAVDRVAMLQNVFGHNGRLAHGPFPATAPYADTTLHPPSYDTTAAKAMLDSSGWRMGPDGVRAKNGRPLRFGLTVSTSPQRRQYSVLLQEQFKRIGAKVDIEPIDNASIAPTQNTRNFDTFIASFVPDPSPSVFRQSWGTAGIGPDGQNFLHYSNKQVDALLDSTTAAFDGTQMKRYASRAIQKILDDAPAIFLYDMVVVDAITRRATRAPMRTDGWWANLADWSIPPDKRIQRDNVGLASAKP